MLPLELEDAILRYRVQILFQAVLAELRVKVPYTYTPGHYVDEHTWEDIDMLTFYTDDQRWDRRSLRRQASSLLEWGVWLDQHMQTWVRDNGLVFDKKNIKYYWRLKNTRISPIVLAPYIPNQDKEVVHKKSL